MGKVLLSCKYEDIIYNNRLEKIYREKIRGVKKLPMLILNDTDLEEERSSLIKEEREEIKKAVYATKKEDLCLRNSYIFYYDTEYSEFYEKHESRKILFCGHCGHKAEPLANYTEILRDGSRNLEYASSRSWEDIQKLIGFKLGEIGTNYYGNKVQNYNYLEKEVESYYCSKCGSRIGLEEVCESYEGRKTTELVGVNIFDNTENGRPTIKLKFMFKHTTGYNEQIQTKYYTRFFVFNYVTGFTYAFEARYTNGKKVDKVEKRMTNVTYMDLNDTYGAPQEVFDFLAEAIRDKISEHVGYKVPSLHNYITKKIRLSDIASYNRMPNLDSLKFRDLVMNVKSQSNKYQLHPKIRAVKSTLDNPLKALMKVYNIPYNKTYRKLLLEDLDCIGALTFINKHFSTDNAAKVLKEGVLSGIIYRVMRKKNSDYTRQDEFMEYLKERIPEKVLATKMLIERTEKPSIWDIKTKNNTFINVSHCLADAARTYSRIKEMDITKLDNIDLSGNMRDIHDELSIVYESIRRGNYPLIHQAKYKKLECTIDGYNFVFAKDTEKLRHVGSKMHICVGGYDRSALDKRCNIIVAYDKEGEYKVCIELSGDYKRVIQTKLHCNARPDGEIRNVLLKWIDKNKLQLDTYDISKDKDNKKIDHFEAEGIAL